MKKKLKVIFFNLFITVLLLEIIFRFFPFLKTSSEKSEGVYVSYYGVVKDSWYHTWSPGTNCTLSGGKEFSYRFTANSLGLREKEFSKTKPDSVTRIIVLGDSYAEGVGADYDSTWPRFLEKLIRKNCTGNFEVLNAGVSGNDPFYSYTLLRDKLISYQPDIVIASANNSDVYDFVYRGGSERFLPDGTTHYKKKGPWFEPLFQHSYFFRLLTYTVLGYGRGLVKNSSMERWNEIATDSIAEVFTDMKNLCDSNNIRFLSVIHSNGGFVKKDFLNRFRKIIGNTIPDFQIIDKKIRYSNNIDITPHMAKVINEKNSDEYVWRSNYHFTGKGYELFANTLFNEVMAKDSAFFNKSDMYNATVAKQ